MSTDFSNFGDILYAQTNQVFNSAYAVVKYNKRLFIMSSVTRRLLYSPPDFIRVTNRSQLQQVADVASDRGYLHISDIAAFEATALRASGYKRR
jgi:hypothetical protein